MTPAIDVTSSADPAVKPAKIMVWDMPTRVFHWMMVLSFTGAYLTAESERWRLVHVTLGYTLGGLVAFRIVWGLVGTRYARFSSFVRGPAAVKRYLVAMVAREPGHDIGHNPAGAVAIVLLLLLSIAITVTGWAVYNDVGGKWAEELHELAADGMLLVILMHIAGVAVASWLHRENLVRAMFDGQKEGAAGQGIQRAWSWLAVCMVLAILSFWWLQWGSVA
ncbi:MAG: cytochrome b/b6 domain-containing protein [Polaromonas sp.]